MAVLWAGLGLIAFLLVRRLGKSVAAREQGSPWMLKVIKRIWIAYAVGNTALFLVFVPIALNHGWESYYQAVFAGMALLVSLVYAIIGILVASRWMLVLAPVWTLVALIANLVPGYYSPLVFAGGMAVLELLPGILLVAKLRRRHHAAA